MTLPMRRGRYAPRRWDLFGGFSAFDDLFDQMSRMPTSAFPDVARISVNSWSPPVDIQETEDDYMIEADLPGVRRSTEAVVPRNCRRLRSFSLWISASAS